MAIQDKLIERDQAQANFIIVGLCRGQIVGSDLVAVDYHGLRLLEKQGGKASAIALGDKNLAAAEQAGLGTCAPENMEVITITTPWPSVGTINGADKIMNVMNIQVLHKGNSVDFIIPGKRSKQVAILDMKGTVLWQIQPSGGEFVSWDFRTMNGAPVPTGMYVYRIACGNSVMRGTVMVAH
jgi:hypothetical protein